MTITDFVQQAPIAKVIVVFVIIPVLAFLLGIILSDKGGTTDGQ